VFINEIAGKSTAAADVIAAAMIATRAQTPQTTHNNALFEESARC